MYGVLAMKYPRSSESRPNLRPRLGVGHLRIALGAIWLADGVLQCQPYMFTPSFVKDVLVPSAQGNSGFVSDPTLAMAHFLMPHIVAWNALFAAIQIALGIGIILGTMQARRNVLKVALAGSFVWSVLVWWLSEGLGGVLLGASPLAGAPGAVLLYLVAGLLLWPGAPQVDDELPAVVVGSSLARSLWLGLWAFSGFLLLQPANQTPNAVSSLVSGAANGEPGILHGLLSGVGVLLGGAGSWIDSLLGLAMMGIGISVALDYHPRLFLVASMAMGIGMWVFGQALGGILTGQGTDPNSGPLWVLLALCMWPGVSRLSSTSPSRQQSQNLFISHSK